MTISRVVYKVVPKHMEELNADLRLIVQILVIKGTGTHCQVGVGLVSIGSHTKYCDWRGLLAILLLVQAS